MVMSREISNKDRENIVRRIYERMRGCCNIP